MKYLTEVVPRMPLSYAGGEDGRHCCRSAGPRYDYDAGGLLPRSYCDSRRWNHWRSADLPLEKVYNMNRCPLLLTGTGETYFRCAGNIWTEYIHYPDHVEYDDAAHDRTWVKWFGRRQNKIMMILLPIAITFSIARPRFILIYSKSMYQVNYKIEPAQKLKGQSQPDGRITIGQHQRSDV